MLKETSPSAAPAARRALPRIRGAVLGVALSLALAAGGCGRTLDPVGTRIGTSVGTITGQAEYCTPGEGTEVVYWRQRGPGDAADAGGGSIYYPGAQLGTYLEADDVVSPPAQDEFGDPGVAAVLRCPIVLPVAGRYHVWGRAYANNLTDNSVHVGMDEQWPETGRALQVCGVPERFHRWVWTSSQYISDQDSCRGPLAVTVDVAEPGAHTLMFSVREDGFRLDAWLLTLDDHFVPEDATPQPGL